MNIPLTQCAKALDISSRSTGPEILQISKYKRVLRYPILNMYEKKHLKICKARSLVFRKFFQE